MVESHCKKCSRIREDDMSDNQLELLSTISEFNSVHEFMEDDQLDKCLEIVVKLIVRAGEVPSSKAPALIIELQAMATKFAILASYYGNMGKGGVKEQHKKNVYYTLKDAITKLVDALKYSARSGMEYS